MTVRLYEWDKNETGWAWIEVTDNKVINLILRSLNNLIKINSNNEVYTDLQLDDNLLSTATLPVGVTTGRVLQANGRPVTWTLILAKTTSGDNIKILYGDDGEIRVDNGTGVWKNITTAYFKTQAEYDALPSRKNSDWNLYIIVDNHNEPVTITFTAEPEGWGTVSESSITARQWDTITVNNNVLTIGNQTITATPLPESEYWFRDWSCIGAPLPAIVSDDMDIIANFISEK